MDKTKKLVDLLPEGMDESVATEIAGVVTSIVSEQVEARVKVLEAKVHGFLRSSIDQIKEHALQELIHENEEVRDASLFREIKSLFALEMDDEDQTIAVREANSHVSDLEDEVVALAEELARTTTAAKKYKSTATALSGKVNSMQDLLENVRGELITLHESRKKPFKSSEKAVVISKVREGSPTKKESNLSEIPSVLSEESMKLMPFKNGRNK